MFSVVYKKNEKGELQLVNDAYSFNPADNTWTKLPTRSPRGIVGASAVSYNGKIYVLGGVNDLSSMVISKTTLLPVKIKKNKKR